MSESRDTAGSQLHGVGATLVSIAPAVVAAVAFAPLLGGYFHGDDFIHLVDVVNYPLGLVAVTPFMQHLYTVPTLIYYGLWQIFGANPVAFFAFLIALHVLNVILFQRLVWWLTGSALIASFGALAWGIAPLHDGTLSWFCVHGHVLVGTILLLVTGSLARPRSAPLGVGWALSAGGLLVLGSTCFGTGLAVAAVVPVLAWLCRGPAGITRPALGVMFAVPFVVGAVYLTAHRWFGVREEAMDILGMHLSAPWLMLRAWLDLVGFGIAASSVGVVVRPLPYPSLVATVGIVGVTIAALATAIRSAVFRWWIVGLALLMAVTYLLVAMGRALVAMAVFSLQPDAIAATLRYHYVTSIAVSVTISLALATFAPRRLGYRQGYVAWAVACLVMMVAVWQSPRAIDLHAESRRAASAVLAEASKAVAAVPQGEMVMVPARLFEPFLIKGHITSAAVFTVFHPFPTFQRRPIRYVDPKQFQERVPPPQSPLGRLVVKFDLWRQRRRAVGTPSPTQPRTPAAGEVPAAGQAPAGGAVRIPGLVPRAQ